MIQDLLIFIENIIISHGAWGIFWAGFLEEVLTFVPSTLVIMTSGFFMLGNDAVSINSFFKLFLQVVLPVSLGLTLGSLVPYSIFYFIGEPAIKTFGKYIRLDLSDIEKIKERMSKGVSDEILIFIARAIPFFPMMIVNVFCGLIRYPVIKFVSISFLGVLVRATIVGFLGWQFGSFYKELSSKFETAETILVAILILGLLYLIYRNRSRGGRGGETDKIS